MGILSILGDFLLGVGVVLLGVAAIYHVFAGTLLDDKKDQDTETQINQGLGARGE